MSLIRRITYLILILCVLAALLLRVHETFKQSAFGINKMQYIIFIILYSMTAISGITLLSIDNFNARTKGDGKTIFTYFLGISYFITSVYGMFVFVYKMYTLTKMRQSSIAYGVSNEIDEDVIKLNNQQMKFLQMTSKYISLLSLAIITTWITFIDNIIYGKIVKRWGWTVIGHEIFGVQYAIDCAVNVLCLYLQYSFARKYYEKYCQCLGNCCLLILKKMAERQMRKEISRHMISNEEYQLLETDTNDKTLL